MNEPLAVRPNESQKEAAVPSLTNGSTNPAEPVTILPNESKPESPLPGPANLETEAAEQILREAPTAPGCRSLLVIPTTAPPARRVLRALTGEAPLIGKRLVAVTGDGIAFNVIYRDAAHAWPIRDLSIPLVLFTRRADLMGVLVNRRITTLLATLAAILIVALNVFLLFRTFTGES